MAYLDREFRYRFVNTLADIIRPLAPLALMADELAHVERVQDLEARPEVSCQGAEVNQVFEALLSNAGKAMADGGTLTVRSRVVDDKLV